MYVQYPREAQLYNVEQFCCCWLTLFFLLSLFFARRRVQCCLDGTQRVAFFGYFFVIILNKAPGEENCFALYSLSFIIVIDAFLRKEIKTSGGRSVAVEDDLIN